MSRTRQIIVVAACLASLALTVSALSCPFAGGEVMLVYPEPGACGPWPWPGAGGCAGLRGALQPYPGALAPAPAPGWVPDWNDLLDVFLSPCPEPKGPCPDRPMCPRCGSDAVVPIIYGYPGPELLAEAEAGQVELGGCLVGGDEPDWRCRQCGFAWKDQFGSETFRVGKPFPPDWRDVVRW